MPQLKIVQSRSKMDEKNANKINSLEKSVQIWTILSLEEIDLNLSP